MSEHFWVSLTTLTGEIGFALSVCSNIILLSLIHFRSHRQIGSYKHLLMFFCFFTLFYSCVELLLRPLIHIYDDTLFLIQRKWFDWGKTASRVISTMYCFCYALSFTIFALQFLYRYVATCKSKLLRYFSGFWFLMWIFGACLIAFSWQMAAFFLFPQNERTEQSFLYICNHTYDIDPVWADYMPYKYFYRDEKNERHPDIQNMMGIIQHLVVIFGSFYVLFYCGFKTWSTMKTFKGISNKTRHLQHQLFRALVVQTCFPMIFMYIPTAFCFSCPFFDLDLGATTNYQTVIAQLYPGVDPLILLILIDDYRNALLQVICLKSMTKPNDSLSHHANNHRISPLNTVAL